MPIVRLSVLLEAWLLINGPALELCRRDLV